MYLWIGIFILSLLVELMTVSLISIWFSIGAIAAFIVEYLGYSIGVQWIVFIVVSFILVLVTKPFTKKVLQKKVEKTNIDAWVGMEVEVLKEIAPHRDGEVKKDGIVYDARVVGEETIPAGEWVMIDHLEGNTIYVRTKTLKEA